MSELIVPGKWKCDACNFSLYKRVMYTQSGTVGTNYDPTPEACPNGCPRLLRAYTWKEEAQEADEIIERLVTENHKLKHEAALGLVRYCPECGGVGPVPSGYRDCCPDGSRAALVPPAFARACAATFKKALGEPQ